MKKISQKIPSDIFWEITKYNDIKETFIFARTCKNFQDILKNENFWKEQLKKIKYQKLSLSLENSKLSFKEKVILAFITKDIYNIDDVPENILTSIIKTFFNIFEINKTLIIVTTIFNNQNKKNNALFYVVKLCINNKLMSKEIENIAIKYNTNYTLLKKIIDEYITQQMLTDALRILLIYINNNNYNPNNRNILVYNIAKAHIKKNELAKALTVLEYGNPNEDLIHLIVTKYIEKDNIEQALQEAKSIYKTPLIINIIKQLIDKDKLEKALELTDSIKNTDNEKLILQNFINCLLEIKKNIKKNIDKHYICYLIAKKKFFIKTLNLIESFDNEMLKKTFANEINILKNFLTKIKKLTLNRFKVYFLFTLSVIIIVLIATLVIHGLVLVRKNNILRSLTYSNN